MGVANGRSRFPDDDRYGTQMGGDSRNDGTVYEVSFDGAVQWSEKVLCTFAGYPDGSNPSASIRFAKTPAGTLPVMTTQHGGANQYGAVISASLTGTENTLYSFGREPDGNYPELRDCRRHAWRPVWHDD